MINIDDKTRRLSQATIVIGYKQENKAESIEFEIPDYLKEYGKKICFKTKDGKVFSKLFDNTTSNIFTFTRTETQYGELNATIEFFKTENEDMIVYKTSMLHIIFNESIICEDEVQPDEPKIPILESLIEKVTDLNNTITENEEVRNNNEDTRISNENSRIANETQRDIYYTGIQNKVNNGEFNGATFTPSVDKDGNISWTNNKGLENPSSQNIRGPQGIQGPQGEAFKIKKTYSSIEAMQADFDNMEVGDYVMIVSSVELEDNAKLYTKTETEWVFITDFSGSTGIQGEQGPQGIQGIQGERGIGISKLEVIDGSLWVTLTDSTTQNAGLIITDEVKQWIVNQVTDNAKSDFNTYYDGKVTDFDNHVTVKINEFNTNATDKTNEYNQNAEELINKVEQVQAENEALKAENKLIKEQIPSANISGNSMHIEDSSNLELSVERISGGYYQASEENSPSPDYPSEIETVGSNVNLFDKDSQDMFLKGLIPNNAGEIQAGTTDTSASNYLVTIIVPCLPNLTYIISRYAEGKTFFVYESSKKDLKVGDNVTFLKRNDNTGVINEKITTGANAKYLLVKIYNTYAIEPNTYNDLISSVKVEKGTVATPCSPYGMGSVKIKVINSNLLDFNVEQNSKVTVNKDGTITINGKGGFSLNIDKLQLKAGITYYQKVELISGSISGSNINNTFLSFAGSGAWISNINFSQTILNEDTEKTSIWVNASAIFNNAVIKIWANTDESDFILHQSQTAIMPIQQEMLTGDYIKDVEHHEWGKIESYNGEIITTDYISTTGELTTGATVYYKLAEPIDLELTSEQKAVRNQKLHTYKNITNISLSDELASIDVEYKRDLETMFNNIIKQIPSSTSDTTET